MRNDKLRSVHSWVTVPLATLALALGVSACSSEMPPGDEEMSSAAAESSPRAFFVEPQDGATVASPVHAEFGSEGYEIAPVPAANVLGYSDLQDNMAPRPGVGHYHVGVDMVCPPNDGLMRQSDSWLHFGEGETSADMHVEPGAHTLTLQVGNDDHRALEGGCTTISITVAE